MAIISITPLLNVVHYLLPSFVHRRKPVKAETRLYPTAYMDGVRGVASLCVVFHHYTCQFTPSLLHGWGSSQRDYWLLQFPVIRIVHAGPFMVDIFFVLSGCVLSLRCLQLARERKHAEFLRTLVSSVFRRWIRLFLPVVVSMIVATLMSRARLWDRTWADMHAPYGNTTLIVNATTPAQIKYWQDKLYPSATDQFRWVSPEKMIVEMATVAEQFWHLEGTLRNLLDPFRMYHDKYLEVVLSPYNAGDVLWTIPIEWTGSMVVFIVVLLTAWARPRVRMLLLATLVFWCQCTYRWYFGRFISGVILAELLVNQQERSSTQEEQSALTSSDLERQDRSKEQGKARGRQSQSSMSTVLWTFCFFVSLFFGSQPTLKSELSWGYRNLLFLSRSWKGDLGHGHDWPGVGSFLFMLSVIHCVPLQSIFTTRIARYLGRISFSLYLVHVIVLWSLGTRIFRLCFGSFHASTTQSGFAQAMLVAILVVFPFTIWVADVYTRAIDEKSVALARWVARRCLLL